VVTTRTLGESLRRDNFAKVTTKLERVIAGDIGQVVNNLVVVLNAGLRIISWRPDDHSQIFHSQIWKSCIQAWKREARGDRKGAIGTSIGKTRFICQFCR